MLGTKDEIRIEQAVVHILDSALGMPDCRMWCWTVVLIFLIF